MMIVLDIYCSVHRNILWNNQQMSQCALKFYFSASPLYMFRAAHTPIIRSTILTVSTAIGTIVPTAVDTVRIVLLMMGVCAARNM